MNETNASFSIALTHWPSLLVAADFVNDILSSVHFDLFNWKLSARDFVTNSSTRYCIELVRVFQALSEGRESYILPDVRIRYIQVTKHY